MSRKKPTKPPTMSQKDRLEKIEEAIRANRDKLSAATFDLILGFVHNTAPKAGASMKTVKDIARKSAAGRKTRGEDAKAAQLKKASSKTRTCDYPFPSVKGGDAAKKRSGDTVIVRANKKPKFEIPGMTAVEVPARSKGSKPPAQKAVQYTSPLAGFVKVVKADPSVGEKIAKDAGILTASGRLSRTYT